MERAENKEQKEEMSHTGKAPGPAKIKESGSEQEKQNLMVRFSVEMKKDEFEREIDLLASKYSKSAKIPGFRKGHVPPEIVKKVYRKMLADEAIGQVIPKLAYEMIEKKSLRIVSPPVIEKMDYKEGMDLKAEIIVEQFPEFQLPDFKDIKIQIPAEELKGEKYDEEKYINAILEANKRDVPVSGRPVRENDLVVGKIQSRILETKRLTSKKAFYYRVDKEVKSDIGDLYSELIGKSVGDRVRSIKKYPQDFKRKIWAGKTVEHYIDIELLYELKKPALNDEFLRSAGVKTEEEFKKKLREEDKVRKEQIRERIIIDHIFKNLIEMVQLILPQTLVEKEFSRLAAQGAPRDDLKAKKDKKEIIDDLRSQAERSVKLSLIINKIIDQFQLKIGNQELEEEYKKISETQNVPLAEVRRYYAEREKQDQLKEHLMDNKVIEFIKEKISIKEV